MSYRTTAAFVVFLALFASNVTHAGEAQDPWRGKPVDDVTAVLGLPDKIKESGGSRTLIYKLMLPGENPPLDSRIRLLQLPGVGLVAQFIHEDIKGNEEAEFEPTHVGQDGGVVAGGYETNSSANISFDPKSGEIERDWEEGPDPGKVKKITLKVVVDEQGRVSDWSVSPKKYMKDASAQ